MTTTTEPEVNRELFAKIRDYIKAHPEEHDNFSWEVRTECGTTRCTAGWAIWFNDPRPEVPLIHKRRELGYASYEAAGVHLLGLTWSESGHLFYCGNEEAMEMIEHYAEHGREGWELPL